MYGSCKFNTIAFNSLCLRDIIEPEPIERVGGIRLRERRRKVLYKQFFDIIGTKLIFNQEFFNLLGFLLLAQKYNIELDANLLSKIKKYFILTGNKQFPIQSKLDIIGFKNFLIKEQIDINLVKLFLSKIDYDLSGIKLIDLIDTKEITAKKKFSLETKHEIYGQKDIKSLLEALDLLDEE